MKLTTFITGCALGLAIFLFAQKRRPEAMPVTFHGIVDLTQSEPNALATTNKVGNRGPANRDQRSARLQAPGATRIEAPARFASSLWTVDQIPPERLMGQLAVLDVRAKVKSDPGYEISMQDIIQWEQKNGQIPLGAVVVAQTGWKPDETVKINSGHPGAKSKSIVQIPGYSREAAKFLVDARNVRALGIDTARVDSGASDNSQVRQYTLSHSVYHLENVASLDRVPAIGAVVMVAPMKLEGRADGPVRVLALVK